MKVVDVAFESMVPDPVSLQQQQQQLKSKPGQPSEADQGKQNLAIGAVQAHNTGKMLLLGKYLWKMMAFKFNMIIVFVFNWHPFHPLCSLRTELPPPARKLEKQRRPSIGGSAESVAQ